MLPSAPAARAAVRTAHGELHGSVTLGVLLTTGTFDLPVLLGRFHRAHPHVRVRVRYSPRGSGGHTDALLDGSIDLAFVAFAGRPPTGLSAELAPESFVDIPLGWGSRALVDAAFDRAGLTRSVPREVSEYATMSALVRCWRLSVATSARRP